MSDMSSQAKSAPIFECPIHKVTVLEERAIVERRATLTLQPGVVGLRIEGIAPALVDKTLVVAVARGRVLGAKVRRVRIHRSEDAKPLVRKLIELERAASKNHNAVQRRIHGLRDDVQLWEQASARASFEASEDVAWGQDSSAGWEAKFDEVATRLHSLQEEIARQLQVATDSAEELEDIRAQLRNARRGHSVESASLELQIRGDESGESGETMLTITYAVPGACWRPQHRARWQGSVLHFETQAAVWQRTGEDWTNVELAVSTERASLGIDPPVLSTDELRVRKKAPGTQVTMREEEVESAGAPQLASELPGIDDGGDTLLLEAPAKATIRADGIAHRISLSTFTAPVDAKLFVVSELEHTVQQKTSLKNESPRPILAGPIDLIRESGPVGRTKTLYVAPGEAFDIGWGPEHELRVTRETEMLKAKRSKLSGWTHKTKQVRVKISNIGRATHHFEVIERVPVSELESVEVKIDSTSSTSKTADNDGFVRWLETLRAGERASFELAYTVSTKRDVTGI